MFQSGCFGRGTELPAGTNFQPIQPHYIVARVPQPRFNFSRLKRSISRIQVAIEQLCDLFYSAGLFDLVQRSEHVLIEGTVRFLNLTHFGFSDLKANLPRAAHLVFG
jgi:hypothetical protein